jgi:carbamate kinase
MGGNSLLDEYKVPTVDNQFGTTARAMKPVVDLIERGEQVVIVHGNGPQVGFMQLRSELSREDIHEVPLDSLVANTQGSMGYMIQRALREELLLRGVQMSVVTIVTEVEVDPHDHAFEEPTKPIGRFYQEEDVARLEDERGWTMINDSNRGWRRVVASPSPNRIVQMDIIETLVDQGWVVICCGGGGIPVVRDEQGHIDGIEAVIDKDRSSTLLAVALQAKRFIITTGVDAVYRDFLTDNPVRLEELDVEEVRALAREDQFPPGSMRPKMEAGIYYCNRVPGEVIICQPEDLVEAIDRKTGTRMRKEKT